MQMTNLSSSTRRESATRYQVGQLVLMIAIMFGLGLGPVFGLMLVPERQGQVHHQFVTGSAAERIFEADMKRSKERFAAYRHSVGRLTALGKKRSAVVIAYEYHDPAPQTIARRIAEWFVPTLHASTPRYMDYVVLDDWSGYDADYDGHMEIVSESEGRYAALAVGFSKNPATNFQNYYSDIIDYSGFEPEPTPQSSANQGIADRVVHAVRQELYPALEARTLSKSWWDRLHDWSVCTVTGCSTAATSCWIANVLDAETLWVPCFTAWCGGSEVGCAVYSILQ